MPLRCWPSTLTTGEYKWHFQMVPGDDWDYDSVQQLMLAGPDHQGQQRKVIMQANKNGFFYVIDRINGKFISGPAVRASRTGPRG